MEKEVGAEQWKAVVGAEGYEVSDAGRVRSYMGSRMRRPGAQPKILSVKPVYGYSYVTLFMPKEGRKRLRAVHRIVLEAFRGPCPPKCQCCHNDGNRANNRLENLRWDTSRNNYMDRVRHNTVPRGEKHANSKLLDEERDAIRNLLRLGYPMNRIASLFGVCKGTVRSTRDRAGLGVNGEEEANHESAPFLAEGI